MNTIEYSQLHGEIKRIPEGKSLVITDDGQVFLINSSRIRKNGQEKRLGTFQNKTPSNFDGNGLQEYYRTNWFVDSPSVAFKNYWDHVRLDKKNYKRSLGELHPVIDLWMDALENLKESDSSMVEVNIIKDRDLSYVEIKLPKNPIIVGFYAKTMTPRYYKHGEKKTLV